MKQVRRFGSLLLALVMVFAVSVTALAAGDDENTGSTGNTGSITITNSDNVSVAGRIFYAYRILDVVSYTDAVTEVDEDTGEENVITPARVVYTVPEGLKGFYKNRYHLNGSEGDFDARVVACIAEEEDLFDFAAAVLKAAKGDGVNAASPAITPTSATAEDGAESVTIKGLALGYYVVEDVGTATPISALILDTTNPTPTVVIKADKPSVEKKISTKDDPVDYNNAAIGDQVPYVVNSHVPDMTGYTKYYFVLNDTLSKGLTFNGDVKITIGTGESAISLTKVTENLDGTKTYEANTYSVGEGDDREEKPYYTVTVDDKDDGTTAVEIVFSDFIQWKEHNGESITITYSAVVNTDAVIGETGNPNEIFLIYSNNPNVEDDGDENNPDKPAPGSPTGQTPKDEVRTYVTGIELIKIDQDKNRLTGAEFQIAGEKLNTVLVRKDVYTEAEGGEYWKLKDGSYTTTAPVEAEDETDTSKYYESTDTKYSKNVETNTIVNREDVTYTGTVGADGVLRFDGLSAGTYTITEIKAPAGYNLLKEPLTVTIGWSAPAEDSDNCTWTYTGTDTETVTVDGENREIGTKHVTVVNQAGTELPSTGGMGTTLFYVIGGILTVGAAVLLVTKKRMSMKES